MDDVKKEDMDSHDCYFNAMLNFAFCGEVRLVDDPVLFLARHILA